MDDGKKKEQELAIWKLAVEELQKTEDAIYDKIYKLERDERTNERRFFVGKCFTYEDYFMEDGKWWIYVKITSTNESGYLIGQSFWKNNDGRIEFISNSEQELVIDYFKGGKAIEITEEEYQKVKNTLLKEGGWI